MAKRNGSPAYGGQIEFVVITLTEDQEKVFRGWQTQMEEHWWGELATVVSLGYKLGVSFDAGNACFIVSLTCKVENDVNEDLCMTARADDWLEALQLILFKHQVVCEGKSWQAKRRQANWG